MLVLQSEKQQNPGDRRVGEWVRGAAHLSVCHIPERQCRHLVRDIHLVLPTQQQTQVSTGWPLTCDCLQVSTGWPLTCSCLHKLTLLIGLFEKRKICLVYLYFHFILYFNYFFHFLPTCTFFLLILIFGCSLYTSLEIGFTSRNKRKEKRLRPYFTKG